MKIRPSLYWILLLKPHISPLVTLNLVSKNGWAVLKEFFNYHCNEAHVFFPISLDMTAGVAESIQVAEKRGHWKQY